MITLQAEVHSKQMINLDLLNAHAYDAKHVPRAALPEILDKMAAALALIVHNGV